MLKQFIKKMFFYKLLDKHNILNWSEVEEDE